MTKKIGFWSTFELVTVSQIGSGLMLPACLAAYGTLSLYGWVFSTIGAMILALVFSQLCNRFPRVGGPHAYVHEAFGAPWAFFTGWTYWVISWVSTSAIIASAVGYLTPFIGSDSSILHLLLEMLIIVAITLLNLQGVGKAGETKLIFVLLKMVPLLVVPIAALFFFDKNNFVHTNFHHDEIASNLNNVLLLTFWGFIGFETATAAVGDIHNADKTIPKVLILGTLFVAIVYFVSSLGIMGFIPGNVLMNSDTPYADAAQLLFGKHGHFLISLICCIICISAVNAWTLASGQIALGITQDGLMPSHFARKNKHGAPAFALILSCLGTLPLLMMAQQESLADTVNTIIDISVTAFLFVYIITCLAFLRILWRQKSQEKRTLWILGFLSLGFCLWILVLTSLKTLLAASLFVLSGLPVYFLWRNKLKKDTMASYTLV